MDKNKVAKQNASNNTLTYRKDHPNDRCSFGIPGVPGIVVFDNRLFAGGKPPKTIVVDCGLATPVAKEPTPAKGEATTAANS